MLKRLLPLAAVLMLACGGGEVSEPTTGPAVAPAEPAVAVADTPSTHCEKEVLYHCALENGMLASVCNEDGWMVYRYGAIGDLEAEYPAPDMTPNWVLLEVPGGKTLKFTMHDNEVLVSNLPGVTAGVTTSAPDDTILSSYDCVGEVTSNWTKLAQVMPK